MSVNVGQVSNLPSRPDGMAIDAESLVSRT